VQPVTASVSSGSAEHRLTTIESKQQTSKPANACDHRRSAASSVQHLIWSMPGFHRPASLMSASSELTPRSLVIVLARVVLVLALACKILDSPDCLPIPLRVSAFLRFTFLHFLHFSFPVFHILMLGSCGRLSWIMSAFKRTLKQHLAS